MPRLRAPALAALLPGCSGRPRARAATPGSLDSGFGGGVVTLGSGTQLLGVGVEPGGEVIAVGQASGHVLVQCFNSSGGSAGQYVGGSGSARAVAIQPDGLAVVAGASGGLFVQRFKSNCTPDASFHGGTPVVASALGSGAAANGVAVGSDGRIVAAGSVPHVDPNGESTRAAVARFTSTGGLDSTFGSGGTGARSWASLCIGDRGGRPGRWQGRADWTLAGSAVPGDLWVGGTAHRRRGDDSTFAGGSAVYGYSAAGAGYATLNAVTIQNDGKIVAAGSDLSPPPGVNQGPSAAFVRLSSNGVPDPSFGSGGIEKLSSGTFTPDPYGAYGVGIAGGGRVVGAGAILQNGSHDAGLWALAPGGAPDTEGAFGSAATVMQTGGIEACGMAIAPDGSLVIVGDSVSPSRQGVPCQVNGTSSAFAARYVGFGPPPKATPPAAATESATGIGEVSATLNGAVNPNGLATDYHFDYGTGKSYGTSTPTQSAGSASAVQTVSQQLTGLSPATTYHYRLVASNADGTTRGSDVTFTTSPARPPSALTGGSSGVGEVSATVSGSVSTGGLVTSYHFDYGRSRGYGSHTAARQVSADSSDLSVSAALTRLRPGTTYHYRLVATNSAGTSDGVDETFTTAPRVELLFKGLKHSYSVAKIGKSGLVLTVGCSQPCKIGESILIPTKTVKRLNLGKHRLVLGSGSVLLSNGGKRRIHLHLNPKSQRLITRLGPVLVAVVITTKPIQGGPTVVVSRKVTLNP